MLIYTIQGRGGTMFFTMAGPVVFNLGTSIVYIVYVEIYKRVNITLQLDKRLVLNGTERLGQERLE